MRSVIPQLAIFLLAVASLPAAAQEQIWHYSPYQMRVWVALAPAPELNAALEQQILRTLAERAEAVALAPWTLTAEPAPPAMRGAMLAGLEWMTVEQLSPPPETNEEQPSSSSVPSTAALSAGAAEASNAAPPLNGVGEVAKDSPSLPPRPDFTPLLESNDKLTLIRVAPDRGGFLVEARELDCRTRQWSEVITRRAGHASLIALEAFRAVEEAFRPLARIEQVKGQSVTVRLRAGGLVETSESPAHFPEGMVLVPVVRLNDRHGLPRTNGIQVAPWAYIAAKETIGPGRLQCDLVAGVATPLGARSSSRIEKYGLAAPVRHEKTDLIVRARPLSRTDTEPPPPLAGYEVHERVPGAEELTFVARTDWRGQVEIGKTDHPLRVLYVKNGTRILSKFPVVPGLLPRVEVNVMNDDRRLEVEGFVSGLQSRILDLVVTREVLALRIRNRIGAGKMDEAETLMKEFRLLPKPEQMQAELNREEARQRLLPADNATKALINRLFTDTRDLITKHLQPTLEQSLEKELLAAKSGG
jgi:hypothetical protein